MEDTDQLLRVTTPFIRPELEVELVELIDRTPTTSPGSTPGSPRRRLARGTVQPPVETVLMPTPALPVRLIDPPAQWGYSQRVDLALVFNELAPVAGEIDTQPVRRIGAGFELRTAPWGGIAAGVGALALVLTAVWMVAAAGSTDPKTPPAAHAVQAPPVLIVTQLEEEPEVAAAAAEIERPAVDAPPAGDAAPAPTHGTLMIGSKPPCRILIDGKDTGLTTPNRGVRVPAGRHTITLVNRELGISDSSTLVITAGRKAKLIRDLSAEIAVGD
jgi:hypothetical protein